MNCRHVQKLLSQHLDGLPSQEAGQVTRHLEACAGCRRRQDEFRALGADLRELVALPPSPDAERRAIVRWRAERAAATPSARRLRSPDALRQTWKEQSPLRWIGSRMVPLGAAVAAVALLALLGFEIDRRESSGRSVGPPAQRIARQPRERGTPLPSPADLRGPNVRQRSAALERHVAEALPDHSAVAPAFPRRPERAARSRSQDAFAVAPRAPGAASARRGGDLSSLNGDPVQDARQWGTLAGDGWATVEARVRGAVQVRDDFVRIPFPRLASVSDRQMAQSVESYKREAAIVDARLSHEVTIQQKGTALSDVCERLRSDTGIQLGAGQSVADEKVTLFCEKMPLREVMRHLSRPFGYTWLRSGKTGEYRYELVQDLRSQLLEEELRNRDQNEALLALDAEMERYRKYLSLTPDEALARAKTAAPEEKRLLERLAIEGWGPVQMYFRLSRNDLAVLRAGQGITFSADPRPGERPLPPDVARGVPQSWRDWRVRRRDDGLELGQAKDLSDGLPPASVPEVHAKVDLYEIKQREAGQFSFMGASRIFSTGDRPRGFSMGWCNGPVAVGRSPVVLKPDNAAANAKRVHDPSLRSRITVRPLASCGEDPSPQPPPRSGEGELPGIPAASPNPRHPSPLRGGAGGGVNKATSADVLEALHGATGMPIVADYYTRLFPLSAVSVQNRPLFDALNQLSDAMRLRWLKDPQGDWLQFRSTSYFNDRIKEVPNRLLAHWAASRQKHGTLTLDDIVEIALLPDAQLGGEEMAEGARLCFGLAEWDVACNGNIRSHLRYLAGFAPAQRQEMLGGTGLAFTRMPLAQQQGFLQNALGSGAEGLQSLEDLAGATLRVDYTVPGWFEWRVPGDAWLQWAVPVVPGREGTRAVRPAVRERTREGALQAARRVDPQVDDAQIVPTTLKCTIIYIPGASNTRDIHHAGLDHDLFTGTW